MSATGFDGKDDGSAIVETSTEDVLAWYQPGDIEIISNGVTTLLLTANEGKPSVDGSGTDDVIPSTSVEFNGLMIDSEYGFSATGSSGDPSYVYGARSFSVWTSLLEVLRLWCTTVVQSLVNARHAHARLCELDEKITIREMTHPSIIPSRLASLTAWWPTRTLCCLLGANGWFHDLQHQPLARPCLRFGFVPSVCGNKTSKSKHGPMQLQPSWNWGCVLPPFPGTGYTGVTGVNEGYDAILVSNDESGSLTLFSLQSNLDIPGCTDSCACNYNSNATMNDGSCDFSSCAGCTYPEASNYNSSSLTDDGTCEFTNDCPADLNNDGSVNTTDLLDFLAAFGVICP